MRTHSEIPTMHGSFLRAAVEQRKAELELELAELQNSPFQSTSLPGTIEESLARLDVILPGAGVELSPIVAEQLARWLDTNKHLGARPRTTTRH